MRTTHFAAAVAALALVAGPSLAAEMVNQGKIKSVSATDKQVVVTDSSDGKSYTYNLADNLVIDRGEKAATFGDLKEGDDVSILFDKGVLRWTARYILVRDGANKDAELCCGAIKNYNSDRGELVWTDPKGKDKTATVGTTTAVRLDGKGARMADLKIGDKAVVICTGSGEKCSVKKVCVERDR